MPRRNDRRGTRNGRNNTNNRRGNNGRNTGRNNRRGKDPADIAREGDLLVIAKGYIRDVSPRFQIQFKESDNGTPYLSGAKIEIDKIIISNGEERVITKTFGLVAFDKAAEDLQDVFDGCWIEVECDLRKVEGNDGNWYDQLVVLDVLDVEFPED